VQAVHSLLSTFRKLQSDTHDWQSHACGIRRNMAHGARSNMFTVSCATGKFFRVQKLLFSTDSAQRAAYKAEHALMQQAVQRRRPSEDV
jgi:hypothetical protein